MDPNEEGQDQQVDNSEGQENENPVAEDTTQQEQPARNGAWDELLSVVPSQLHSQVTPHLQKWDSNFQKKLNEVQEQYKPYKDFLDNEVKPEQINYSLNLLRAVDERPGEVISAIKEYAKQKGISLEEAVEEVSEEAEEENNDDPIMSHPKFKEMQSQLETMAQILVQQQEAEAQEEEDAELESELAGLKKKYGDFDVDWVLTKAISTEDTDLEKHVKAYQEFENGIIAKQRKPGPKVMSGSGSAPNQQIHPKEMDASQRKAYVASLLEGAHRESS